MHLCKNECEDWRSMWMSFSNDLHFMVFELGFHTEPGANWFSEPSWQQLSGILLSPASDEWDHRCVLLWLTFYTWAGDLNSGSQASIAHFTSRAIFLTPLSTILIWTSHILESCKNKFLLFRLPRVSALIWWLELSSAFQNSPQGISCELHYIRHW